MKFLAAFACLFAIVSALDVHIESRIVHGENAKLYSHPHEASLQLWKATSKWTHVCGAVLIGPNKFLTAAHCINGQNIKNLRIEVGLMNISAPANAYKQTLSVSSIVEHPNYRFNDFPHDIGKVYTSTNVTYNKNVQPATLATPGDNFTGTDCVLTGWGNLYDGGRNSAYLQMVHARQITSSQRESIMRNIPITNMQICAFSEHRILSFGQNSCSGDKPSVYTRVSSYLTWINAI